MEFIISLFFFAIGLGVLVKGADFLVSGASSMAQKFKISPIVIGLTIVAFGTSAPELVVSLTSAISGSTTLALGNVVGSNIANILLILGASAIVHPLSVHKNTVWKEIPMSFLAAIVLTVLALQDLIDLKSIAPLFTGLEGFAGSITRSNGLVLLSFFIIFIYYTFGIAKVTGNVEPDITQRNIKISALLVIFGLVGLMVGSKFFVDSSIAIAKFFGVSETMIGLTIVAVGTSLPELVTSVVATFKKKVDIAVGNVVGSNIFNIFLILGTTSLVKEIPLPNMVVTDILVLFGATILLFILLFVRTRHTISKFEGSLMLTTYFCYIVFVITRG